MLASVDVEPGASTPLPLTATMSAMWTTWSGGPPYGIKAFTGREWDPEKGLYYGARYYDSKLGRFISEDPIPYVDGPNPYTYVGNDPVNFRDPLGLAKDSVTASLEAAIRNGNPGKIQAILDTAGDVLSPAARQVSRLPFDVSGARRVTSFRGNVSARSTASFQRRCARRPSRRSSGSHARATRQPRPRRSCSPLASI